MPVKRAQCYTLHLLGGLSSFSPGDSTTYYWSTIAGTWETTAALRPHRFLKDGIIKAASISTYGGTAGTAEDWTMIIRINNTTDYTVATLAASAVTRNWLNLALNIPVKAGDYFEIKTTTPAWVTNPAPCQSWGTLLIEY
jgi:hypothetical protein